MILVRDRRAEDREDAVAGALHYVAVVAADRVDHQAKCRIDNRARFFGIEVLLQLRRSLDIGKQCRDRLALTFNVFGSGRLGYSNLMPRGFLWRDFGSGSSQRLAAGIAESRVDATFRSA